ncbi:uncharacterized protein LOC131018296 [Salvia miltiorrhiza]|uniref:uncharacterized protein LOC131018296 n=1 Tax=Salvia miltiorrhiza TaxID=226208 RepID=UPI0025ABEE41|nr:uncharacterized protein LOC131018296 [Salvia miltiorrhiza]
MFPTEEVSQFDERRTLLLGACIGYDSKCDDYKILRVCQRVITAPSSYGTLNTYQLYSFKEDSWNQIDRVANPDDTSKSSFQAAFVRGKCYWCVALDRIESWDCSEKTLSYMDFPPERRITRYGQLVQINGGDSLGFVGFSDRDPKVGHDYELWVWSEELKRWDRQFSVSLGGAVGRPVGTIFGTFLFLHGMTGTPDEYIRRLVAYDWSKEACKELGIRNYRFRINVLCDVEGTVVLPCGKHGKPISRSSIINNPPIVTVGPPDPSEKYCICGCHRGTSSRDSSLLHELKNVPDCIHCGARIFEYEPPTFCCDNGKVKLAFSEVPTQLDELFTAQSEEAIDFRRNIRAYNSIFSFTSFGVKLDKELASARQGVYYFRAQGMVYHDLPGLM